MTHADDIEAPVSAQGAYARVERAAAPGWVVDDAPGEGLIADADAGGARTLLVSEQYRADPEEPTHYRRWVHEIRTASALSDFGHFTITFNPSHQRVELHHARLIRDGAVIDALEEAEIEVFRREENLESRRYDGYYTVVVRLLDVRPGDRLDYAFSWRGEHPLLLAHLSCVLPVGRDFPVGRAATRLYWPQARPLNLVLRNVDAAPVETRADGWRRLDYVRDAPPPYAEEPGSPWWRSFAPTLAASEHDDWAPVARWAEPLYAIAPDAEITALATEITDPGDPPERRARKALEWVQREIRYLSVSYGQGGFRPRPPALALKRRYGDCKDKAVLLIALLRALDIEAAPALVHTRNGPALNEAAPSPTAFDHVIVRAVIDGREAWLDPTVSGERGPAFERGASVIGHALVIGVEDGAPPLRPITRAETDTPRRVVTERIDLAGATPDAPHRATFTLETVFARDEADFIRRELELRGAGALRDQHVAFYREQFADAALEGGFEVEDDEDANRIALRETVVAPVGWRVRDDSARSFEYRLDEVQPVLGAGRAEEARRGPLGVVHPRHRRQVVEIVLPKSRHPWRIRDENLALDNEAFAFTWRSGLRNDVYRVEIEVRTKRSEISAARAPAALADQAVMLQASAVRIDQVGWRAAMRTGLGGVLRRFFGLD